MSENESDRQEGHDCFCMGTGPEMFAIFKKLNPESARKHFRAARIEFLKGMRELIDKRIADLSRESETKGTKVSVE